LLENFSASSRGRYLFDDSEEILVLEGASKKQDGRGLLPGRWKFAARVAEQGALLAQRGCVLHRLF
jgi:hypothetical protein